MKSVGILGATGAVGLEGIEALLYHPWFTVSNLYASERSADKKYRDACRLDTSALLKEILDRVVLNLDDFKPENDISSDIAFSALPSEEAKKVESKVAQYLPVVSTASAFRYEDDVPILITEINPAHVELLKIQQKQRGWKGFVAPEPNCTTVGLAMSLKPLHDAFGIRRVVMTSYQAVSGAGHDAVAEWEKERASRKLPKPFLSDIAYVPVSVPEVVFEGNVIGHIKGEEEKVKQETLKILGEYADGRIVPANFRIDCFCVRVPTYRGHLEAVFVEPVEPCSEEDVKSVYEEFNENARKLSGDLPSSPKDAVVVIDRAPQPRFDVGMNGGMSTVIGRIDMSNGWVKYLVLSDNLRKGAAKGSVQVMEYLLREGYIK